MAEIVAAALTSHAPLITGKPEIAKPEQRDRLYAGFHELRRRLAAARPDLLVTFVNDHLQPFPYRNLPAVCVGLAAAYAAPRPGGARLRR
ncbi:MAG: extradiol ring-cleavage dioxygenase, partial [candidate division NC10 bacterium]